LVEMMLADVPHHADDLAPGFVVAARANLDVLSDRVFRRPVTARSGLADDDGSRSARDVALSEGAACDEGSANALKIVRSCDEIVRRVFTRRRWRAAFDLERARAAPGIEREP
jgi:hypothetical protein